MNIEAELIGGKALESVFRGLRASVQKKILRGACTAAARPIRMEVRRNARKIKRFGTLAKSIKIAVRTYKSGSVVAVIGADKAFSEATPAGRAVPANYLHLVELGTARSAAKPFLRPAFEAKKGEAAGIFKAKIAEGVLREAAKAKASGK